MNCPDRGHSGDDVCNSINLAACVRQDLRDTTPGSSHSPKDPWYSSLVELSVGHAVLSPCRSVLPSAGELDAHPRKMFSFHAWAVCRLGTGSTDSLLVLPTSRLHQYAFLHPRSTRPPVICKG